MMARQRRSRKHRGDPIGDLQEWQNHQYDPGYWSNLGRLRLFSGGRQGPARLLLTRFAATIALMLIWVILVSAGIQIFVATVIVGGAGTALLVVTLVQLLGHQERRSRSHKRRRQ